MAWPPAVSLQGAHCALRLLRAEDASALADAVRDGELWSLWFTRIPRAEDMADEIARRLALRAAGSMLPFVVLDAAGVVVGMTTYMNIDAEQPRVEIGSTWLARSAQRSAVNTECKRLLLTHAFETLACIAVEFRTHRLNPVSRRAIERLGAQLDGVLRAHQRMADGSLRDTAVYSITAAEWPSVKAHLNGLLAQRPVAAP